MDAVKALADTNMKISESKTILYKIQETETEYLVEREKKAVSRVQKVLEESKDLILKSKENYEHLKVLSDSMSELSLFLSKSYEQFLGTVKTFKESNDAWDWEINRQQEEMNVIRNDLAAQRSIIENDKKSIKRKEQIILEENIKIADRRGVLERAAKLIREKKI